MARVELRNISRVYPGGVRAVDDLSLTIDDQEFVVLVGPSGCGKSTTLRIVAGLEDADAGSVHIGDRDVSAVSPRDRDIAMVFQNYALYPHMTVYGNLSFGLRLRKMPGLWSRLVRRREARAIRDDIHRRVLNVADLLDIRALLDRKPRELSGGQRQRVALGRAIIREPVAFLFDEPLSNLDARLRVATRAELKRLHQRLRTTTIFVTHDQEEAMTLGDRIVVMKDGRIQQADPPLRTYHFPRNRFVAGFIGMPPMNFFNGSLRKDGEGLIFVEGEAEDGKESVGGLTATTKGFTLSLSSLAPSIRQRLAGSEGRPVVLGIRPEHLSLDRAGGEGRFAPDGHIASSDDEAASLEATVSVVEPLGSSIDLYLKTAWHEQVVARVESPDPEGLAALAPGSLAKVHVDLRRVHLFEPGETGMNLSLETTSPGQPEAEMMSHATA